ncbi:MAG: GDP-mannose 4,6-dehydratase [Kiritimatiellae bacterium]|nr:GDP-mannose 4,6-dehydratase [Kiritimatiellia bacterium]
MARPFQLLGPGISSALAPGAFRDQVIAVREGRQTQVITGRLDAVRDFLDVRDAAEALWLMVAQPPEPGIYNLCSGIAVTMEDVVLGLMAAAGVEAPVALDPQRSKPADIPVMVGHPGKLRTALGWLPRFSLPDSLNEMIQAGGDGHSVRRGG